MEQMTVQATSYRVTVPAGTYFLGDPCYAVPDEDWMPLLESCGFFGCDGYPNPSPVGKTPAGVQVLGFSTRWGDGRYRDQHGNEYPVDAGLIGLTPHGIAQTPSGFRHDEAEMKRLGQIVTFRYGAGASTDGEGRLVFGTYRIDTSDEED